MNPTTEKAIEQVEINNKDYYDLAYEFAVIWVNTIFKPFSSEDLKEDMYAAGHPKPR